MRKNIYNREVEGEAGILIGGGDGRGRGWHDRYGLDICNKWSPMMIEGELDIPCVEPRPKILL